MNLVKKKNFLMMLIIAVFLAMGIAMYMSNQTKQEKMNQVNESRVMEKKESTDDADLLEGNLEDDENVPGGNL